MNETKPKKERKVRWGLLIVIGLFLGLILCVGTVAGGIAALSAEADPDNQYLQQLAVVPVLNLVIPPEKRSRAILSHYLKALEDGDNRETLRYQPFEYSVNSQVTVDDMSYVGYLDLTTSATGARQDSSLTLNSNESMDMGGITTEVDLETVLDDDTLYFKLNEFPSSILSSLSTYSLFSTMSTTIEEDISSDSLDSSLDMPPDYSTMMDSVSGLQDDLTGQWFSADVKDLFADSDLEFIGNMELKQSQEDAAVAAVLTLLDQERAEYIGTEKIQGQLTYHYRYDITKQDVTETLIALGDAVGEQLDRTSAMDISDALFEEVDSLNLDLWFNDTFTTVKVENSYLLEGEEDSTFGSVTSEVSVVIWNIGKNQSIDVPEDAEDIVDYVSNYLDL